MNNILVTGGAGFVGSCLIRELIKDPNNAVCSLDNYFTGKKENHIEGVCYIEGDCRDIEKHVTFSPDVVYHFGEYSRVSTSFEDHETVWESNVQGTYRVLEFCRKNQARLIYSASSTKFGDGGENRDCSPYAFHKSQNTELINNYGRWFGVDYVICYFYNVYGAGQISEGKYATVIGIFEQLYLQGKPLTVVTPGTQERSFTHVEDVTAALMLLKRGGRGDGYCIGTEETYQIVEVAKMFNNNIVYLEERLGERLSTAIDLTKMNSLGWRPKYSLKEYIRKIKENRE